MNTSKIRPPVKIKLNSQDWAIELVAFAVMVLLIILPLHYLSQLPERIPIHFNAAGIADGFGSKSSIWILPAVGGFMYLILTVLFAFPQLYNYPVEITENNAPVQYRLATRFIRILKLIILIMFLYLCNQTIHTALGKTPGLGKAFLPVFLIITFGSIAVYIVMARNNRHNS